MIADGYAAFATAATTAAAAAAAAAVVAIVIFCGHTYIPHTQSAKTCSTL